MGKIQANWLQSDIVKAVVDALGADNIKFVGGAVRDTLAGLAVADIDAATRLLPNETIDRLKAVSIKVIPTGLKHGTVTAVVGKQVMEITTLRFDVETDGRHAEVAFTTDWLEDAKRRDFTINALYADPDGALFDPFGGIADLASGTVRFIGCAGERIEEDALRILRFFRFYGRFGKGKPDGVAVAACSAKRAMVTGLSAERVRDELLKMLALDQPFKSLSPMMACGVLEAIYGSSHEGSGLEGYLAAEQRACRQFDPMIRFYHLAPKSLSASSLSRKFRLSNKDKQFLCRYEQASADVLFDDAAGARRFLYRYGSEITQVVALMGGQRLYQLALDISEGWQVPSIPVTGKDLLEKGVKAGPGMGAVLSKIEATWMDSDFTLSKAQLLKAALK